MRILITGGAGFLGSHLAEKLVKENHEIIIIDNFSSGKRQYVAHIPSLLIHDQDIRSLRPKHFRNHPPDVVFHFAAFLGVENTLRNPINTLSAEIEGTINILKVFTDLGVKKFVFASSSEVYGEKEICSEEDDTCPKSAYSVAKLVNEHYFKAYSEEFGLSCLVLRYFNVYGPRQDNRFVISRFISRALNDDPLYVFGDGTQTRTFAYVSDSVRLSCLLYEKSKGFEIFNVGNPSPIHIIELAKNIKNLTNSSSEIKFQSYEEAGRQLCYEVFHRQPNMAKAVARVGSFKWYPLDKGLLRTIDYIKAEYKQV